METSWLACSWPVFCPGEKVAAAAQRPVPAGRPSPEQELCLLCSVPALFWDILEEFSHYKSTIPAAGKSGWITMVTPQRRSEDKPRRLHMKVR